MSDTQISRTMSHALRHEPWLYELEPDAEGWVPLAALVEALRQERRDWAGLAAEDIQRVVAASDKQRYVLDGERIRAAYGHSLPQKLAHEPAVPPALLLHGTAPAVAEIVLAEGLRPMGRQYVHLSVDAEMAEQVGRRKAAVPVLLRIDAAAAHAAGVPFYRGNDRVWLADTVPPAFIAR